MSGHSKWSKIKRKKGETDGKRANVFTKIGREIAVVVKAGGADPDTNAKLRDVIAKARSVNMPGDNVARCISKAAGADDGAVYEEMVYEGYGPSGVAMIVEALTDNKNRSAADIRHFFDKFGGNLGTTGCVSFMFEKKGMILIADDKGLDEDQAMMDALEAGAEDFSHEDGYFEITTEPASFSKVRDELEYKEYKFESAEITMIPSTYTKLTDAKDIEQMERLIEHLEEHDDVQNVYTNWEEE
jgi:YebC/PmpR family DNA-binding regulatory protein